MEEATAVSLQNVSKKFRLYGSPRDRFLEIFHPFNKKFHREFWALRNIDFTVPKGKTVGIVGRNGSGKTTLLQVICSILQPTTGGVQAFGRISALLELGSGFNPEFTGRENVLMNGKITGFSDAEMKKRMPLIEAFAEIGEFIDQPVKTYSSGMFVRLAFAAAINIDPDILVVDEALAVGDAKFQQKCFDKFLDFQKAGKTIVFVSHNTDAVVRHCDYAILLEKGEIIKKGAPKDVTNCYLDLLFTGKVSDSLSLPPVPSGDEAARPGSASIEGRDKTELNIFLEEVPAGDNCKNRKSYNKNEYRFGDKRAEIIDYLIVSGRHADPIAAYSGDAIDIYLKIKFNKDIKAPMAGFSVKTIDGITVYGSNTRFSKDEIRSAGTSDIAIFKFRINLSLIPGDFFIELGIAEKLAVEDIPNDIRKNIIHLFIHEKNIFEGVAELGSDFEEVIRMKG